MQSTTAIIRSVIGDAKPYEFTPGLKVSQRIYVYGVMTIGDELHVMGVHEDDWRQVQEWETELITAIRKHFVMFSNYTEERTKNIL